MTMSDVAGEFTLDIEQQRDYQFLVKFDRPRTSLLSDEPSPLGNDEGPSPSRLLAAAVGNCLAASLLFCARKARMNPEAIRARVKLTTVRNERKRLRVGHIDVTIDPGFREADFAAASRCLDIFRDYCTVSESVRQGIDISVQIKGFEAVERTEGVPAS